MPGKPQNHASLLSLSVLRTYRAALLSLPVTVGAGELPVSNFAALHAHALFKVFSGR